MAYKHGIYTENVVASGRVGTRAVGTVPVYIGTAPIFMTADASNSKINKPVLISSFSEFVREFGYSDNWNTFTLCEAAYAHFKNNVQTVAPIIVINIFDPATHTASALETVTVNFVNKVGYIANANGDLIASTLTKAGTEFTAEYTSDGRIKVTLKADATSVDFTCKKADVSKVSATNVEDGIKAVKLCGVNCGVVPNIVVSPVFGETYYSKFVNLCEEGIDGKWECVTYLDIPVTNATIDAAISYKATSAITSKYARLHYPQVKVGAKMFHLSVLDAVATQIADAETDGVSCRSSSNRKTMCDTPALNANNPLSYSESDANKLNANGITTVNYIGGSFRIWGGHMANYSYANIDTIEPQDRSDASIRMQVYLNNWLKREHIESIDRPLTRRDIDNVLAGVNIGLNSFVNSGYLVTGECYFDEGNNPTTELADGNLVLDVMHTEVPNGKSVTFKMQYDVLGLNTLYGTEGV